MSHESNKEDGQNKCLYQENLKAPPDSVCSQPSSPQGDCRSSDKAGGAYFDFMKWFKHESTAIKDEKIQMIIERFGGDGYMLFFGHLELCAEKLDENLIPQVEISWKYSRKLFGINRTKVELFLNYCETIGLLSRAIFEESYKVTFPKLLKRLDNWTQDKARTSKSLGSHFPIEQEEEQEEEQEPPKVPQKGTEKYLKEFSKFWDAYPRKNSKGQAEKAWKRLKPPLETVLKALEVARACPDWTKDGGQFIPYPATWINAKGWLDEPRPETVEERDRRLIAELSRK